MYFETERLVMRPFEMSDAEALFRMESLPIVYKYLGMAPCTEIGQVSKYIASVQQQYRDNGIGRSVVILKESNELIGWSGLKLEKDIRLFPYYDVGYRFHPDYWGNGYATESAMASLNFGFKVKAYPKICAAAEIENLASNRILSKIGMEKGEPFVFEGTRCNWYSITSEQLKTD